MQARISHEIETMQRQLSRMIIDMDDGSSEEFRGNQSAHADIMAVHYEFFAKRLINTFTYFN